MVTEACVSVNIPKDKKMQKKKHFNKSVNIAPWHYDKKSIELYFLANLFRVLKWEI